MQTDNKQVRWVMVVGVCMHVHVEELEETCADAHWDAHDDALTHPFNVVLQ